MATARTTVDYIVDQIGDAGLVAAKPMFGEFGLYCDGKMIAIIADEQLFVKPTEGGRLWAAGVDEASPYPGAKPCLLIEPDRWDDREWMSELARITAAELPAPKIKPSKRAKQTG
ncbi:TfoX/Sxy family protein [Sphingomonas sp. Tas61C01]|uniref:TfoX/Sxy family protein n=1 Tax=Sphingomonas sp. Tas61C01 TaxID=3458297 RepID=UPI00403EF135